MLFVKRVWHYLFFEPFSLLVACIVRPGQMRRAFEHHSNLRRLLRLFLPMFVLSYPFTLMFVIISFPFMLLLRKYFPLTPAWAGGISYGSSFWLIAMITTSLGIGIGLWIGRRLGLAWSIVTGIVGGCTLGAILEVASFLAFSGHIDVAHWMIVGLITTVTGTVIGGTAGALAGSIGLNRRLGMITGIRGGLIGGAAGGFFGGLSLGMMASLCLGTLTGVVGGMGRSILASQWKKSLFGKYLFPRVFNRRGVATGYITGAEIGVQIGIPVGIVCSVLMRILSGIAAQLFSFHDPAVAWGIAANLWGGLAWGLIMGCFIGSAYGIWLGIAMGNKEGWAWGLAISIATSMAGLISSLLSLALMGTLTGGIAWGIGVCILGAFTFILCYPIGCSRWPLYPFSAYSSWKAFAKSQKNPQRVFYYLKHSSIHWDENGYALPLPGLTQLLMLAVAQDSKGALKEIIFISQKRASLLVATQTPAYELAMRILESYHDFHQLSRASKQLAELKAIRPEWMAPFTPFNTVSELVALYSISRRPETLRKMRATLDEVAPAILFEQKPVQERLAVVASNWREMIQDEENRLSLVLKRWRDIAESERTQQQNDPSQLDNPYCPGPVLSETNSPFVGRRDLVRLLEAGLKKGQERLPLMLWGERRMGKSSTLQQLQYLFEDPGILPIFFDLQSIPTTSSAPALLFTLADGIQNTLIVHNIHLEPLSFERLNDARRENEAAAYRVFDQWLKPIERVLKKQEQTLLLLFDEFEKLVEVAEGQYLDLRLLLNWFRHVVQHRPQLAVLFSGMQSIGKMPPVARIRWTDYFVNFQTYKVSFLQPDEARVLITRPVAHFPAERIFHEGVVKEVMDVAGCHPFLLQAACSIFIDHLNVTGRRKADLVDMPLVINQVLERYGDTYFLELWGRTNADQQNCMLTLNRVGEATVHEVAQRSGLDERTVGEALLQLRQRDLISRDDQSRYRLAIPLFSYWLNSNIDFTQEL